MFSRLKIMNKKQRGIVLIELLVVIAIISLIAVAVVMSIFQVFNNNAIASNHMNAVKEVQNAGHWLSLDAEMAQTVVASVAPGFPLSMAWIEWEGDERQVIYNITGDTLQREHYTNGTVDSTLIVANNINPDETSCVWDSDLRALTVTLTATIGESTVAASETKIYEVSPRPG
jgi:prepilin-type N-terminal cleavage/methylation domain-containing protein